MRSTTFPHELHAGSSLMFIASSPRNEAIHLQSRSIEMKIKIYSPSSCGAPERIASFSRNRPKVSRLRRH